MKASETERKRYFLAYLKSGKSTLKDSMKYAELRTNELSRWLVTDAEFRADFYARIDLISDAQPEIGTETGNPEDQGEPQSSGQS